MSTLNTISKLTSTAIALGICFTTGVAQAATLGSTGTLRINDPSSFGFDYLGAGALSGTRLSTGSGSQYNFSTALSGSYAGVSISGTVSIGEVDFAPTGAAQVDIINSLKRAKIFKISNVTITNGSANTLDYTTSQNGVLFDFSNKFADFYLSQFYTVIDGQIGKLNANGSLSCDQIQNFNIGMTAQGLYSNTVSNTVYAQRPMYADKTMVDGNCNFKAQVDNRTTSSGGTLVNNVIATNYNSVNGWINSLVLQSGYTLKLTNSWNMFFTDSEVSLTDENVEDLVNVSIGKTIDDADNFGFKVFAIDPDTGVRGEEIQAQSASMATVPEPSTLFGLMAFGGFIASRFKKKTNN